jgi:type II secretory pathway component PulF
MAKYEYEAFTRTGEPVQGTLSAESEAAAYRELAARKLSVTNLLWCPAVDESGTLRDDDVTTLVHAVGAAAATRLPLEVTLAVLADETDDPRLASVAHRLTVQLQRGVPLDRAIAELDQELPAEVQGLMRAGIESGDLAGTFEKFTQQRQASRRLRGRIRAAIAYPILITAILVPLLLFLSVSVIPVFGELFEDFELPLPPITELILQTSDQVPGLVAGLLLIIVIVPLVLRLLGGRWLFHRFRAATPFIGQLWMWTGQREFAALLASFLDLRLPMTSAVAHTGEMLSDRNVARSCRRVIERLEAGEPLSACLNHSIQFDRSLVALVGWGELNGVLPDALRIAADVFDDRAEQHAALLRRVFPPVTLVTVTTIMFFIIVGLVLPLVKLIEALSM